MSMISNICTLIRSPSHLLLYLSYQFSRLMNRWNAILRLGNGIMIGNFLNYSEYASCRKDISPGELSFLMDYDFPEGDIIDVGANLGIVTLIIGSRYPRKTVHSFEPNQNTMAALTSNIRLNGLSNVKTCSYAVSSHDGQTGFINNTGSRATARMANKQENGFLTVPTVCIDTYCRDNNIRKVAILKIDVEGFEAEVLKGARKMLADGLIHYVYYEVCPGNCSAHGTDPLEATRILQNNGFIIYRLDAKGILIRIEAPDTTGITLSNWIAARS